MAVDGCLRGNDTDFSVPGGIGGGFGTWLYHTHNGNVEFLFQFIQCIGTRRIACHHDGFHMMRFQKTYNLPGKPGYGFLGFVAVGHPCGIPEIYDFFIGNLTHDFSCHGQPADTGIKHADG